MLWLLIYALSPPKLALHIALANAHPLTIVAIRFNVRHVFYDALTRALTSTRRSTPLTFPVRSGSGCALTIRQGTVAHDTTSHSFVFLTHDLARFPAVLGEGSCPFLDTHTLLLYSRHGLLCFSYAHSRLVLTLTNVNLQTDVSLIRRPNI